MEVDHGGSSLGGTVGVAGPEGGACHAQNHQGSERVELVGALFLWGESFDTTVENGHSFFGLIRHGESMLNGMCVIKFFVYENGFSKFCV